MNKNEINNLCKRFRFAFDRGSEDEMLRRYYRTAQRAFNLNAHALGIQEVGRASDLAINPPTWTNDEGLLIVRCRARTINTIVSDTADNAMTPKQVLKAWKLIQGTLDAPYKWYRNFFCMGVISSPFHLIVNLVYAGNDQRAVKLCKRHLVRNKIL